MLDLPFNFADGAVLPELPTEAIFANPETYNPVPVMLGTNRDEPALFMAWDPHWTENFLWIFRRVKNPDAYLRAVRYGALAWKARGVDQLADAMAGAGNGRVFAYRFDWDEQDTVLGFDLGVALGAAHAMELPFVWGNFDLLPIDGLFPETEGRDALARSIRSYWAEFAYNGAPGRGREGDAPHWLPWGTQGKTSLLLDTTDGGGIRMMEERVSLEAVARQLATDPTVADEAERCDLFDRAFRWAGDANLQDLASAAGLSC